MIARISTRPCAAGAGRFVHEGIAGATFTGAVTGRVEVGGLPAVRPRVEGAAWITGESELVIDDDDPLRDGFVL